MALPNILTDHKLFDEYLQTVKVMGSEARKEGKVYKNCTEDEKLNEFLDTICIYSMATNNIVRTIFCSSWWKGYKGE